MLKTIDDYFSSISKHGNLPCYLRTPTSIIINDKILENCTEIINTSDGIVVSIQIKSQDGDYEYFRNESNKWEEIKR